MIDKEQACTLLVEAIKDEDKAQVEYELLKAELGAKRDKTIVAKIMRDEARHARKLKKLYARLKCDQTA